MSADLFDEKRSEKSGKSEYFSPVVEVEKMGSEKVRSREKPKGENRNAMYFKGKSKPLLLNVTNAETMTMLAGSPDVNRWVGMKIKLYVDKQARYPSGQTGPAIRIHQELPSGPADAPTPEPSPEKRAELDKEHAERIGEDEREPGSDDQ